MARCGAILVVWTLVLGMGSVWAVEGQSSEPGFVEAVVENGPAPEVVPADGPADEDRVIAKGLASWYGGKFHGRRTASGEIFDKTAFTAAHKTLPFGTLVRVKSLRTGKEVVVRINDRGPHVKKRVIDLSGAAASALGLKSRGVATVVLLRE
jgi:rare lipoprotein A